MGQEDPPPVDRAGGTTGLTDRGRRRLLAGGSAAILAAVAGIGVRGRSLLQACLSNQARSTAAVPPDGPARWVWTGGVTAERAEVRIGGRAGLSSVRLALSTDPGLSDRRWIDGRVDPMAPVATVDIDDLIPDTRYHYVPELDGEPRWEAAGSFRTFPDGPASFLVAFGGCAWTGSNGAVFDAVAALDPLLFQWIGDFHYADVDADDLGRFAEAYEQNLRSPGQAALYRSTPIAYVWDDHDFGPNNADRRSPSRPAAMAAYRRFVPSYHLAGPSSALHQAFSIGRVRFVITDARSDRDPADQPDDGDKSLLGAEQKAWLKEELTEAAASHQLVVWVQPVPWTGPVEAGADHWAGYHTERRELADFLVANVLTPGARNLVMVSGDAHMVAIDDGTNTDNSEVRFGGFPLLHVAAIDQLGSAKGGPYSHGQFPGGGRFGTLEVIDDGTTMEVVLTGRTWEDEILTDYRFTVA